MSLLLDTYKQISDDLEKKAEDKTEFNEDVDAEVEVAGGDNSEKPSKNGEEGKNKNPFQKKEEQAPPVAEAQVAVAAPPPPTSAGAAVAREFLGPDVFQRAISGDPGAITLIAQTAGHIAAQTELTAAQAAPAADPNAIDPLTGQPIGGAGGVGAVDPNAPVDPNAAPVDPNAAPVDPNAAGGTQQAPPQSPEDEAAQQMAGTAGGAAVIPANGVTTQQGSPVPPMGGGGGSIPGAGLPAAPMGGTPNGNQPVTMDQLMQILQQMQGGQVPGQPVA